MFPEGTLLRHSGLMPFRAGAFQVAAQAGIPVVPVALRGVRSVLRDETWYPRRAPIAVTIGAPIAPGGQRLERGGEAARPRARRDPASTAASATSTPRVRMRALDAGDGVAADAHAALVHAHVHAAVALHLHALASDVALAEALEELSA